MLVSGRSWKVFVACATLFGIACATTGCGSDDSVDRGVIEARLSALQESFDASDMVRACQQLTPRAKALIGSMGHASPEGCREDLAKIRKWMANGDRRVIGPAPRFLEVEGDADSARATVRPPGTEPYAVRFANHGGRWKLDGVFDAGTASLQEGSRVPPDEGEPELSGAEDGAPVEVSFDRKSKRLPCPKTTGDEIGRDSDCRIEVTPTAVDASVLNPFGRMPFATCDVEFTLHVEPDGRTWTDDFVGRSGGAGYSAACGDFEACGIRASGGHMRWTGRITMGPERELRHRFTDMCLDTCVGKFRGDWTVDLRKSDRGWRLRADDAMVGVSGWTIDGEMRARTTALSFSAP